jgi:hypothetical protein
MLTTNNNIKIVRFHGGEDIIADFIEDKENETVMLINPMQVIFKRLPATGQTVMMMMPWLPIEIIKDNTALVDIADILTIIDPKDSAIKHYGEVVMEAQKRMDEIEVMSESEMEEDDDEEDEESEDLSVEEMFDIIKEKRGKNLH